MIYKNKSMLPIVRLTQGSTLLEVLVSVFIMAFGIMALMLAQLKSVSNVREAEMQTRVAQAVQNLSAGMLSNPDTISNVGSISAAQTKLSYTRYNTASRTINVTTSPSDIPVCGKSDKNNGVSNTALATCHTQAFTTELQNALPNATAISYSIQSKNNTTTINVEWTESNGSSDSFKYSYSAVVGD
ncbi:type IV pilus modification protein PilV [Eikenella sp. S3360]|uniref:Type IV pilus modification protein PilV n=1 Tax=Eikenella glucosivorans TaxID=2766967 RepID=A0ABS0N8L1_9NEIS|nr:type IV pilus modification protein PilV [Eikenella glucosivorans]MBH5328606.1 type IV pilus modification protein PilV [Eikenella glucosivorans]